MGRVVLYTVIQVPVMIIAALALAMLIDSYIVKHITAFRLSYFLPYAIPGVVASIIWVYLYNGQISPIVKGLAAIGIKVNFFGEQRGPRLMANITTWTFTGYNMLDLPRRTAGGLPAPSVRGRTQALMAPVASRSP